ncbi:MAG: class I SAM-dependent methyltransferase [Candidatus Aenigmarchaeota archaeon]|nr:class I SAM-dependent methyltransferase [Candidatus Aenigmarchaeota archaeon]
MKKGFFEGEDFRDGEFRSLIPKYYPPKYRKYVEEEVELLKSRIPCNSRILEAGVGIGRLVPELAPLVEEFIGIDNSDFMIKKSKEGGENFSNVKIIKSDIENVDRLFPEKYFDYSLCLWNTLGNVEDEILALKKLSKVTKKSIFVTVYKKGTLKDRKDFYKTVGIKIKRIDEKNEIFYSKSGLRSRSYSLNGIGEIAKSSNLRIKGSRILGEVMFFAEFV